MEILDYLKKLKSDTSEESFEIIMKMVDEDIKFNNVSFGRTTSPDDFITRCMLCHETLCKC